MRKLCVSIFLCMFCYSSVFAVGALYARRPLSNESGSPLWLVSYDAKVTMTDQIAVTHVDHVFRNESSNRLEGIFIFPLPKGAVVTELALWMNGKRVVGDVMERDTARAVYESIVRRSIDPALLEYMGDNTFKLSVFPIEAAGVAMSERRIEITYAELLPFADENVAFTFFMKTANLSSKPVERASVSGTLTSQKPVVVMSSSTHPTGTLLSIQRVDDHNYSFTFGNEKAHSERDLIIEYRFEESAFALNNLVYIPDTKQPMFFDAAGDDGYFLLWVTPPQSGPAITALPKRIALVADVSSSMSGTRIVQLRKSLGAMVDMLSERDLFSLYAFSSGVASFKTDMVEASAENKSLAHTYINALAEAGLTNYEDALRSALRSTWSDSSVNVVVFFTDGKPTWPVETSTSRILTQVKDLNTRGVSIYSFGVGNDLDQAFLQSLAVQNSGAYYTITSDAAIATILSGFMKRISFPLLKNLVLDYGTISEYDIFPRTLPSLFAGTQLSVLGRFRNNGVTKVKFSGRRATEQVQIEANIPFDETQSDHPFVPRMWASSKIDYLLGEVATLGAQKELVDNVKTLGKKYSIITPYTSMLVIEPGQNTAVEDKVAALPSKRMFTAAIDNNGRMVTLRYSLPRAATSQRVVLRIFDAQGKLVKTLVNENVLSGNFIVRWDCRTDAGSALVPGAYIAVLTAGSAQHMVRIQMVR